MAIRKKRASAASPVRIFVRIGALRRFHTLTQKTTDLPVEVSWDRRRSDRIEPAEDRREQPLVDRRKTPPYTWDVADFVVVEEPPQASKRRTRKR